VRLLILGSGYLGAMLARLAPDALHTSRSPAQRAADRRWLRFDADDPTSWGGLTGVEADAAVVALPLHARLDVAGLWNALAAITTRVVVIGSTSALRAMNGVVSDETPIDARGPRAAAEEAVRLRGASLLHAAGIYGPARNPLDWVRRGRIANAGKLVNLIHVDDLARACLFVLERFRPALRAVASDGRPRRWSEIITHAVARGWIVDPHLPDEPDPLSKRVLPRLLPDLGFTLAHPDLFAELERLES
jgi:nucleoside-diphosphate-sugar epimerase